MTTRIVQNPQPPFDPTAVRVPDAVRYVLPVAAGYTAGHLAADILASFCEPMPPRHRLKEVVAAWTDAALNDPRGGAMPPLQARDLAVDFSRFFSRFRHSDLRQQFLDLAQDDPIVAANAFLNALATETNADDGANDADKLVRAFGRMNTRAAGGLRIPFLPPGKGLGAGSTHAKLVARAWRLSDLIQRLRVRYAPYAHRSVRYREVPAPDDVDVVPLRSFAASDLRRLTLADLALPDDEFYPRLARREVRQVVYREPIPNPRRFVMLLDVSGSMDESAGAYTRAEFATASAICLLQSALAGGNEAVLIRFDAEPHDPLRGTPAEIVSELLRAEASGGGTSIDRAIKAANEYHPDEIILVTDGDDQVRAQPAAPLVTYFAGGTNPGLKRLSRQVYHIEEMLT